MAQAQLTTADIPRLLAQMRSQVQSETRKPVSAAIIRLSDAIECAAMIHAAHEPDVVCEWADYGLGRKESEFATILMDQFGKTVPTHRILDEMYPIEADQPSGNILAVFACKVRQKIASSPYTIENVWGVGYRMVLRSAQSNPRTSVRIAWRDGIMMGAKQAAMCDALFSANGKWLSARQVALPAKASTDALSGQIKLIRKNLKGTRYHVEAEHGRGYRMIIQSNAQRAA